MAFKNDAPKELCEMLVEALSNQVRLADPQTGRLPMHIAIVSAHGKGVGLLLDTEPETIHAQDPVTGLSPFELALDCNLPEEDTGENLECIYCLLRADPVRLLDCNAEYL